MLALALDVILLGVPLEAVVLVVVYRRTGRGVPPKRLVATLAAGFFVMLALRFAIGGAGSGPVAACLLGSLVAHVTDLAGRWRD